MDVQFQEMEDVFAAASLPVIWKEKRKKKPHAHMQRQTDTHAPTNQMDFAKRREQV